MSRIDISARDEESEASRLKLMGEIRALQTKMRNTNRKSGFAEIRDEHPDIAKALFRGRDIRMTDLGGSDIAFIDFRGSDLSGCEFAGATIQGARFEFAKVSRDKLREAQDWQTYCSRWEAEPTDRQGERLDPVYFLRGPGDRFSLSPHLPELVMLDHEMLGSVVALTAEEDSGLAAGRLAIALQPVTNAEFSYAIGTEGLFSPDSGRNPREMHSVGSYLAGLNLSPAQFGLPAGTRACLPSDGLMFALAQWGACAREPGLTAGATELTPGDLAVGCTGREFVQLRDASGETAEIGSIVVGASGRPQLTRETANRPALLRPLFILGN